MDKVVAVPLKNVAGITFGADRETVRKVFGRYREYKKSPFSKNTLDDFGFCHVYYDSTNHCEAFEFSSEQKIEVNGVIVYPGTIDALSEIMGPFELIEGCYINVAKSIGITTSNGRMNSILFGRKNYYIPAD